MYVRAIPRCAIAALLLLVPALVSAQPGSGIGSPNFGNMTVDWVEGGTNHYWSYESSQDWWTLRTLPATAGIGGDIASRFNGCAYGLIGNGTPIFYRSGPVCGLNSGNVERLADAPFVPGRGAKIASLPGWVGAPENDVFVIRGGDTREFWRYSIATNTWSQLPDVPEAVDDAGSIDMTFNADGTGRWQLAVLTRSGSSSIFLYAVDSGTWSSIPMPFTIGPGASLVTTTGAAIEVVRGGGSREFWHFESWSGWVRQADTPGPVNEGSDMAYSGAGANLDTFLYPGEDSKQTWAFSFFDHTWRVFARIPLNNQPPVANAGPDVTLEGCASCVSALTLNSSATFDPDGDRMRFSWREGTRFVSPINATISGIGAHVITLTVIDSRGGMSTDTFTATIVDPKTALLQQVAALQAALADANATIASLQNSLGQCQAAGAAVTQMSTALSSIEANLAAVFDQAGFVLPGSTPQAKLDALAAAIAAMNRGTKMDLFRQLGGKK